MCSCVYVCYCLKTAVFLTAGLFVHNSAPFVNVLTPWSLFAGQRYTGECCVRAAGLLADFPRQRWIPCLAHPALDEGHWPHRAGGSGPAPPDTPSGDGILTDLKALARPTPISPSLQKLSTKKPKALRLAGEVPSVYLPENKHLLTSVTITP